jgi:hypothetical protein
MAVPMRQALVLVTDREVLKQSVDSVLLVVLNPKSESQTQIIEKRFSDHWQY